MVILVAMLPLVANAMKIEKDEIDEFTGKRTIITSWEGFCSNEVRIRFRLQNDIKFMDVKFISDGAIVISKDDKLMFKSTNGAISEFRSIAMYMGGRGDGATGLAGSARWGIKATYNGNLGWFADNTAIMLRLYSAEGYYDRKIKESGGEKLTELYNLFRKAMNSEVQTVKSSHTGVQFRITYYRKGKHESTWSEVKTEVVKLKDRSEVNEIMNNWKSQESDKYDYDCKISKN